MACSIKPRRNGAKITADRIWALLDHHEALTHGQLADLAGVGLPVVRRVVRLPNFEPVPERGRFPTYWRKAASGA